MAPDFCPDVGQVQTYTGNGDLFNTKKTSVVAIEESQYFLNLSF